MKGSRERKKEVKKAGKKNKKEEEEEGKTWKMTRKKMLKAIG